MSEPKPQWIEDEVKKYKLSQIPPDDLTTEQQQEMLDYCKNDPMFFFRYVAQFNIENTTLHTLLLERLISILATKKMVDQMRTMHPRQLKTVEFTMDKLL